MNKSKYFFGTSVFGQLISLIDCSSSYQDKIVKPNILFNSQYVQVPTCGALRYAMLTGILPIDNGHLMDQSKSISNVAYEISIIFFICYTLNCN